MLIESDHDTGAVRVDEEGLAALLSAARGDDATPHPDAVTALASGRLDAAVAAIGAPLVTLGLVVAGTSTRLEHRAWVTPQGAALLLGVRPGVFQLMAQDPAFLTAALVRLTRMRPRRVAERAVVEVAAERLPDLVAPDEAPRRAALGEAGADFAWHLSARWDGGGRDLVAVDGPRGLQLAEPGTARLVPVSNTTAYRILSTLLPTDAELAVG